MSQPHETDNFTTPGEVIAFGYEHLANLRHYLGTHDMDTGALNRMGLAEALANNAPPIALLLVDGTNQKAVNDRINYERGDEAILGTYDTIRKSVREHDVIARTGGDEFIVLLFEGRPVKNDPSDKRRLGVRAKDRVTATVERMSVITAEFLDANPDIKAVGFDIAVGGAIWNKQDSIEKLKNQAERTMKLVKKRQHDVVGKHRS